MKFDDIKKLHQKKYRAEFGRFLVEGEHLVLELQKAALLNPLLQGSELYVTNAYEQWQSPFKTHLISDRQMAQIADTKTPQGIVALVPMPSTRTTPRSCARAWAPSSMRRWNWMWHWIRCARALPASPAWICRVSLCNRRLSQPSNATCSAMKPAACPATS